MNIYLMRHGETPWNQQRKLQGQSDIPLNEYGKELAQMTRTGMEKIPIDAIYCSPLIRTKETAEIMASKREVSVQIDERLIEIGFGLGEGALIDEIHEDDTSPLYDFLHRPDQFIPMEGGESFAQVEKRCRSFMEEVLLPLEGKKEHVLLVTHGAFLRVFIGCVQGYEYTQFWERCRHKNCAVTSIALEGGHFTLLEEGKLYYEDKKQVDW